MLKIGRINSLQLRLLTTSRLSEARSSQRRADVETTKRSKTKSRVYSGWSSGAPFVTSYLSSDAKVILCKKRHKGIKPADIAAADFKYGAQQVL